MNTASILWAVGALAAITSSIDGTITQDDGAPVPNAQVFLEPGLGFNVIQTTTDATGHFHFEDIRPGQCGVFAIAEGLAWGGRHIPLAMNETIENVTIHLAQPTTVKGKIENAQGAPISKAQISRIALTGNTKVAIPLAKLKKFGINSVISDEKGKFTLENIPAGETLALKIGHGLYAQEGVRDIAAGAGNTTVTLHRGILLSGEVFSQEDQLPVANAAVLIRNAQPPHDTLTTRTNGRGSFEVRLKPGVYMYRAASGMRQSANWKQLVITPDSVSPTLRLNVTGTGAIRGEVRDAHTGSPIEGVRLALDSGGTRAAITRTGPQGAYQFTTTVGENTVQILDATGYDTTAAKGMNVFVDSGKIVELPGLWLKSVPAFDVTVMDANGIHIAQANIKLIAPQHPTPIQTNQQGQAHIEPIGIPETGRVIGHVQHPQKAQGALFALPRSAIGTPQNIQLYPYAAVQGQVLNAEQAPVANAQINTILADGVDESPVILWSIKTNAEGRFYYDKLIPGVPQLCIITTTAGEQVMSDPFNTAPETLKDLDVITLPAPATTTNPE